MTAVHSAEFLNAEDLAAIKRLYAAAYAVSEWAGRTPALPGRPNAEETAMWGELRTALGLV